MTQELLTKVNKQFPNYTETIAKLHSELGTQALRVIDRHGIEALWAMKFASEPAKALEVIDKHGSNGARLALLYRDSGVNAILESKHPRKVMDVLDAVGHPAPALFAKHGEAALAAVTHTKLGTAFTGAVSGNLIDAKVASRVIKLISENRIDEADTALHRNIHFK